MSGVCFETLDSRFRPLFIPTAKLDTLYIGCRWAEGPAYFPAGRMLVWSDIPNNRMLRLDECSGEAAVFRQPSNYSNGNTVDRQGRLVTCEHGARRVSRTEIEGSVTTLADETASGSMSSLASVKPSDCFQAMKSERLRNTTLRQ